MFLIDTDVYKGKGVMAPKLYEMHLRGGCDLISEHIILSFHLGNCLWSMEQKLSGREYFFAFEKCVN